jgi:hypothetical protein
MTAEDWIELSKSMGPVAAMSLFVFYVLAKNGLLRVVLRDPHSGVDELAQIRKQTEELNVRVTVLEALEKSNRK